MIAAVSYTHLDVYKRQVWVGHGLGHLFQQVIFVLDFDVLCGRTDLNEIAQHRAFNGCALVYDLIHDIQIDGGDDGALAWNDLDVYKRQLSTC